MNRIVLLIIIASWFISSAGIAQNVPSFKYQGVARNSQNLALSNQSIGLKLTILNSSNAAVYSETHTTRTSELGIFSVNVCSGQNAQGTCSSIDWSNAGYLLKVELDAAGGTNYVNMGNSPILAVPVAVYAARAGSVPGDTDPSPTNEIQNLTFDNATNKLTLSQGNNVDLTPLKNDADADVTNEIQTLSLSGDTAIVLSKNGGSVKIGGLSGGPWTKTNDSLFSIFNNNAWIKFAPNNFRINFGTGTAYNIKSQGMFYSKEFTVENSTNLEKYNTGSEVQGYQVGRFVQNYIRKDKDTMVFQRLGGNFVFPAPNNAIFNPLNLSVWTSYALNAGKTVNIPSAYVNCQGGLGTVANAIGGRPGCALTAANVNNTIVPYMGLFDPNNPNSLIGGIYYNGSQSVVAANIKQFRMQHPNDENKEIWYACIEGPEAAAYERGTVNLVNGEAEILFTEHFGLVVNPKTLTVQLTPLSADSEGLAVIEKSERGFKIKELRKGTGTYQVDWEVKGVRKGYEDLKVIRTKGVDVPRPVNQNDYIEMN
ncbi:MAG TPA: hypothetical protein PK006_00980 [Saprospiraceae bacterium]|nr:hypothetical protein [Saprospiraceae bacterium]